MPRTNLCVDPEQLSLASEIRTLYGHMVSAVDVGRFLGLSNPRAYKRFLADVPAYKINGRPRYFAADVAKKIYQFREGKK